MNTPADIHAYTWLQRASNAKIYLITKAFWAWDDTAQRHLPADIELLEFKTCTPTRISCHELCDALDKGQLIILVKPF